MEQPTGAAGAITDRRYWNRFWHQKLKRKRLPAWHGLWGRYGAFLLLMRRFCPRVNGKTVVELGGGCSVRLVSLVRFLGCRGVALDFAEEALRATERMAEDNACQVETVLADMFEWHPDTRFDIVTHWGVLEHFREPTEVLRTSAQLLKPGGVCVFSMPNMEAAGAGLWRRYSPTNWATHIFHSDERIKSACADSGLDLVEMKHWCVPLLKITAWEHESVWLKAVGIVQLGFYALAQLLPVFVVGHRRVSMERLFVARKRP